MINPIRPTPSFPYPQNLSSSDTIRIYITDLVRALGEISQEEASAINAVIKNFNVAVTLPAYTVAGVPSASENTNGMIVVTNESGGRVPAFSDGTNWRRVTDRAVIS